MLKLITFDEKNIMQNQTSTKSNGIIKVASRSNLNKFNTITKRGKKTSQNYVKRFYQIRSCCFQKKLW